MLQCPLPETIVFSLYSTTVVDVESEEQVDLPQAFPTILHGEKEFDDTLGDVCIRALSCKLRLLQESLRLLQYLQSLLGVSLFMQDSC
jgi:hypothetical protein